MAIKGKVGVNVHHKYGGVYSLHSDQLNISADDKSVIYHLDFKKLLNHSFDNLRLDAQSFEKDLKGGEIPTVINLPSLSTRTLSNIKSKINILNRQYNLTPDVPRILKISLGDTYSYQVVIRVNKEEDSSSIEFIKS